jgi:hypothetical protein
MPTGEVVEGEVRETVSLEVPIVKRRVDEPFELYRALMDTGGRALVAPSFMVSNLGEIVTIEGDIVEGSEGLAQYIASQREWVYFPLGHFDKDRQRFVRAMEFKTFCLAFNAVHNNMAAGTQRDIDWDRLSAFKEDLKYIDQSKLFFKVGSIDRRPGIEASLEQEYRPGFVGVDQYACPVLEINISGRGSEGGKLLSKRLRTSIRVGGILKDGRPTDEEKWAAIAAVGARNQRDGVTGVNIRYNAQTDSIDISSFLRGDPQTGIYQGLSLEFIRNYNKGADNLCACFMGVRSRRDRASEELTTYLTDFSPEGKES